MAPLLGFALLAAIATASCPSGATCAEGWSNTDRVLLSTVHTHIPVGVAIGTYSPNQDVYLAVEWKDADSDSTANHQMEGLTEHCNNAACSSFSQTTDLSPFGDWHVTAGPIAPSLESIYVLANTSVELRLLGQSDDGSSCASGPEVDYYTDWFHDDWSDLSAGNETVSSDSCYTYGHGTLTFGSPWMAGWTLKPNSSTTSDQAMVSRYNSGWTTPLAISDDGGESDHVTMAYNGSNWVAGFHDFVGDDIALEADPGAIVVKDIPVGGSSDPNWPSLQINSGVFRAGWVEPDSGDGYVYLSSCSSSCLGTGTWTTNTAFSYSHPNVMMHAVGITVQQFFELLVASDGTLHLLWWDQAENGYGVDEQRVMYAERCGSTWTAPVQIIQDGELQSLELGRPHMVLDDENDVVHVAFVEMPTAVDFASSAVVWARHQWSCP